jgi:predicted ATPase
MGVSGIWASPIILAARREMENWQLLAMEPTAMRRADPIGADPHLTTQGGHLHATLYRVINTPTFDNLEPWQITAFIKTNLGRLLTIRDLEVDLDPMRQLLMTQVKPRLGGGKVPARSLSDGTLRFLALAVLSEDPEYQGLLCLEEPENAIHPSKMEALVELLKEMVVDTSIEPDEYNPFRQLIMATHSPYLVQLLQPNDLLVAVQPMVRAAEGKLANTLRCLPLPERWRLGENGRAVGWTSLLNYLVTPPKPGIKLPASLMKG